MNNLQTATQSTLTAEITNLENELRRASRDAVRRMTDKLAARGMAYPPSMLASEAPNAYADILANMPVGALAIAANKIAHGDYERHSHAFMPTPAEFAAFVRQEQGRLVSALANVRALFDAKRPLPQRQEPTPEAKARVRDLRLQTVDWLKSDRLEPVDEIAARGPAYWQQIAAITKEPATITDEQYSFREKVDRVLDSYQSENEATNTSGMVSVLPDVGAQRENE